MNLYEYTKSKQDKFTLSVPKGTIETWKMYANTKNLTLTALIKKLISEAMKKDNFCPKK